jgi:hypothetical protein
MPAPAVGEIEYYEQFVRLLQRLDGIKLVSEFLSWKQTHPQLAGAMIRAAKECEVVKAKTLERVWDEMHQQPVPQWVSRIATRGVEADRR